MSNHNKLLFNKDTENRLLDLEKMLEKQLSSGNTLISEEALRILHSGGKRLRPLMTILFSSVGQKSNPDLSLRAAAAIEIMHMATLIHDDTIDNSGQRRGIETTFKKHGTHTAIYTGDWMLIRSLNILTKKNEDSGVVEDILNILSDGLEMVCSGEIDQYFGRGKIPTTSEYFDRVSGKTAALFAASAMIGARITGLSDLDVHGAYKFGMNFGIAFQIRDDIIDMGNSDIVAGKPVQNDLAEGIITLPILLACNKNKEFKKEVKSYLESPDEGQVNYIIDRAIQIGGLQVAIEECESYISKCNKYLSRLKSSSPENQRAVEDLKKIISNIFNSWGMTS